MFFVVNAYLLGVQFKYAKNWYKTVEYFHNWLYSDFQSCSQQTQIQLLNSKTSQEHIIQYSR